MPLSFILTRIRTVKNLQYINILQNIIDCTHEYHKNQLNVLIFHDKVFNMSIENSLV